MSFKLRIEPGEHQLELLAGETLLQAALRLGYQVPYGCRNGICGACQAQLISGQIRYATAVNAQVHASLEQGLVYCCQAKAGSDIELNWQPVIAPGPAPLSSMQAKLLELNEWSGGVWQVLLRPDSCDLPRFMAGQYLELILADGSRRPFSIASSPASSRLELHIRHQPGNDWTGQVLAELQQQREIRLALPLGQAYWQSSERQVLFLAGGTGFAPIKSMIESLPVGLKLKPRLYWGAVERAGLYQYSLAQQWQQQGRIQFEACLEQTTTDWQGRQGSALTALLEDWPDLSQCDLYVAGREALVWAAYSAAQQQGLPLERFFSDTVNLAQQSTAG